jgi:hypothetical protein
LRKLIFGPPALAGYKLYTKYTYRFGENTGSASIVRDAGYLILPHRAVLDAFQKWRAIPGGMPHPIYTYVLHHSATLLEKVQGAGAD